MLIFILYLFLCQYVREYSRTSIKYFVIQLKISGSTKTAQVRVLRWCLAQHVLDHSRSSLALSLLLQPTHKQSGFELELLSAWTLTENLSAASPSHLSRSQLVPGP